MSFKPAKCVMTEQHDIHDIPFHVQQNASEVTSCIFLRHDVRTDCGLHNILIYRDPGGAHKRQAPWMVCRVLYFFLLKVLEKSDT